MYKTVLFDLDGTLLDTLTDLMEAVNYSMRMMGFPTHTKKEVCSFVGNGIRNLIKRSVPADISAEDMEKAFTYFKKYYEEHMNDYTVPYDGIMDLLNRLQQDGVNVGIVSNKADFAVNELSERFFGKLVGASVGEIKGLRLKPERDTIDVALKRLGVSDENAVYIGDSDVDILTAKNASLPCISVTWGFRDREFLLNHGAKCLVDNAGELYDILKKG